MGWSVGYDNKWKRDIGYGVPAYCDHPGCGKEIDRGLSYVCGGEPYGGDNGCGLYFCGDHLRAVPQRCECCMTDTPSFEPTPDHPDWIHWKLTDKSWQQWRDENPYDVDTLSHALEKLERFNGARWQHPDDIAIDVFAAAMKAKMAASRAKGRGGWDDPAQCSVKQLQRMLLEHLPKGDPVDVGNFAMMLFARDGRTVASALKPAKSNDPIDANRLEQMAKEWPDECFLKGSGVLKLIDAIRQLERRLSAPG